MKAIALALLMILGATAHAEMKDQCLEVVEMTTDNMNSWTDTVRQCLNDHRPGLAGEFESLVHRGAELCRHYCASAEWSRHREACLDLSRTLTEVKPSFPARCTN